MTSSTRTGRLWRWAAAGLILGAVLATIVFVRRPQALLRRPRPARPASRAGFAPVTDSLLRNAASDSTSWLTYGHDYANTRFSPLRQINTSNLKRLRPAWIHQLDQPDLPQESTPLVHDGVLYYTTPLDLLIALDARTGVELWRYTPTLGHWASCCGPRNRGPALYGDYVYFATLDAHLIALHRRTGKVAWNVRIADSDSGYNETMAPLAVGGQIIIGVGGAEVDLRGFVDAYDAETGARRWRFWTIPSPEEGGWWGSWVTRLDDIEFRHRDIAREKADSARYPDAWKRGGGSVWTTPAYDPELGLLYVAVGNPSPAFNGSRRPGDNLYTGSIVALDAKSGKLRWYYQYVPHDVWDYDAANPPILAEITIGGRRVPVLAHAGKTGWVYVLDRRTGAPLLRSEPFVPQADMFLPESLRRRPIPHGQRGGASWMPSAFDPRTGMMYVLGIHRPGGWNEPPRRTAPGLWGRPETEALRTGHADILSAIDLATGKIRWVQGYWCEAVGLATAGDLTFCGHRDRGVLLALDTRTGARLWSYRTGGRIFAGPVTYALDGQQYVTIATSGALIAFSLVPR